MKKIIYIIFLAFSFSCYSQQFSYKPLNPAFGGDTFNYNWLLSSATSQNALTAKQSANETQSDLERFGDNLNRQILSQISRSLLNTQIAGIGDFQEPGTFTFGNLNVEVFEGEEGLTINILDTSTGEQTQVIVPNN
ncbi:curli production assembly/transport component CsgF [Leeuwenhoekiella sp. MAR_2009_132]|uniref:curli production assembly/transport component CsgF n=1 Tax=Leeuwenhoekiella sp. MAR_2009_132 TaxID=1392489 RepID=UPI00049136B7|nr:curli production assembly/transport component CsgF [Leeuwenhoekiella sp. MAR_2009_132]